MHWKLEKTRYRRTMRCKINAMIGCRTPEEHPGRLKIRWRRGRHGFDAKTQHPPDEGIPLSACTDAICLATHYFWPRPSYSSAAVSYLDIVNFRRWNLRNNPLRASTSRNVPSHDYQKRVPNRSSIIVESSQLHTQHTAKVRPHVAHSGEGSSAFLH